MQRTKDINCTDLEATQIHLYPSEREYQATFCVYFFGTFRLLSNNKPLDGTLWHRSKIKSLLKWFLLHPDQPFAADHLIDLFWPDALGDAGYRNLRINIHYLRHLLEPSISRGQESKFIRRVSGSFYAFHIDDSWWIDVWECQHQLELARKMDRAGHDEQAISHYRKALRYLERQFLPEDTYKNYMDSYQSLYNRLHLQALERLSELYLQKREYSEALEHAYQMLNLDPYHEPAIRMITDIYRLQGNISAAIRVRRIFQDRFKAELGIELEEDDQIDINAIAKTLRPSRSFHSNDPLSLTHF
jgi:DNA-binding SARP family transcriptional activator